jgi:2-polyprenyl-6-methoxyphenol hydroxylase-like FAD-dependent oxidoreductase
VYERDTHFDQRQQGYGLTLQQASRIMKRLGLVNVEHLPSGQANEKTTTATTTTTLERASITSTQHVVHTADGTVVGTWGLRKWGRSDTAPPPKRQNIHIARQALRYALWEAASASGCHDDSDEVENIVQWDHRFLEYVLPSAESENDKSQRNASLQIKFQVGDQVVTHEADLLVGADGIRSKVRQQLLGSEEETRTPLRYLGCIVILGICPLDRLALDVVKQTSLLDGATVFQTADGTTRIYMMPYAANTYMWQLSFPLPEDEAKQLALEGPVALQKEAIGRCRTWHNPIADILFATPSPLVSGYPVYDRALLDASDLKASGRITLIGDACHPMSPFKVCTE